MKYGIVSREQSLSYRALGSSLCKLPLKLFKSTELLSFNSYPTGYSADEGMDGTGFYSFYHWLQTDTDQQRKRLDGTGSVWKEFTRSGFCPDNRNMRFAILPFFLVSC